jgi:ribosomal protein S8
MTRHHLFASINNACVHRQADLRIRTSQSNTRILSVLQAYGLIRGFILRDNYTTVYLKFNGSSNTPTIKYIASLSSRGRPLHVSVKGLSLLAKSTNAIILIDTNAGVLTLLEALTKQVGGLLICSIIS